jgi:uncharacterized membrane protein
MPPTGTHLQLTRLRIALILRAIIAIEIGLALFSREWQVALTATGVLAVTMIPLLARRGSRILIPAELDAIVVGILFASLFLGEMLDFYERFWWWDLAIHTVSGFLTAIFGFLLVHVLNELEDIDLHLKPGFVALFAFCFSMTLGVLWEVFEYAMDTTTGSNMQKSGLVDTMTDLIVNAAGALLISWLGYIYLKAIGKESFLERWIVRFVEENPRFFGNRER